MSLIQIMIRHNCVTFCPSDNALMNMKYIASFHLICLDVFFFCCLKGETNVYLCRMPIVDMQY